MRAGVSWTSSLSAEHPLLQQLRQTLRRRRLIPTGARVLVATSGGPDSLALLHALHDLQSELEIELVVAHLNHRMRGEDALADERFLRETAANWGVPIDVEALHVP